ncbi:MAG: TIGR03768 family metallophosphoesterase [Candidatus Eremiobacterota bacterium]
MKSFYKYKKFYLIFLITMLILFLSGCSDSAVSTQSQTAGYPIDPDVQTTRQRTVVLGSAPSDGNTVFPYEIWKYRENGYGTWSYGGPDDHGKQYDIMPDGYNGASVTNTARLLNFFTITDIHIVDKEAPGQAIWAGYKGGNSSAYSPVMLYTTHVLDAAMQTVNVLHKQNPFDFGLSLGDVCNSTQYNELRWYMDVIDGKVITPSSGNHAGADTIDYQKPYQAAGLDKTIPWYQTLGNHDHEWCGAYPVTDYFRQYYTDENILLLGDISSGDVNVRTDYMGTIDGSTPYGNIIGVGPVGDFPTPPKVLAADPDRRSLLKKEWMSEFFNTSSNPVGHGFSQTNIDRDFACYSFEPKANLPLKVIVLDDTQADENFVFNKNGSLDKERYEWLISELDKGQTEGKLMIISAHVPVSLIDSPGSYISGTDLLFKLSSYSNLILWVTGHVHVNTVKAHPSTDPAHQGAEYGFWEIETSSLRDFPQEFHTFDILRNSDNTISIIKTGVDPSVKDGTPASISRFYSVAAQQLFKNPLPNLPTGTYNAEFMKKLSPEMEAKIQNYGTPVGK